MITLNDIYEARERIKDYVHRTPLVKSKTIGDIAGCELYFKCENMQKTGSFKIRGAANKILSLTPEEKERGVVCYSAGNHAQGVCAAASATGVKSWVFMPETAVKGKVDACRGYGANVTLFGKNGGDVMPLALKCRDENNLTYIDPCEDPYVMAGQGTAGLEIIEELKDCDAVYVPCGGGGLLSGVAVAIKSISPNTKVIGVEPETMDFVTESYRQKKIIEKERQYSIADGLGGSKPGPVAFETVTKLVDDMVTVTDEEIAKVIPLFMYRTKMLAEPSAMVTLAAVLNKKSYIGKKTVCLLSGGNADMEMIADILKKY